MESTFIEQNNRTEEEDSNNLKPKLRQINPILAFFLNRRNQLTLFVWIFALSVPILCYYFLFHLKLPIITSIETCSVNSTFRVNCGNLNLTDTTARENCLSLSCCFDDFTRECYHSLPSSYFYTNDNKVSLEQSPFSTNSDPNLYVFYEKGSDNVKIRLTNDKNDDFGVNQNDDDNDFSYTIEENLNKLEINIKRKNSQKPILTSSLGPLISTNNYMEITFFLGDYLFGLDKLYFNKNETYTKIIYHNNEDHTTIPAFIAFKDGNFHGFTIDYEGPLEISVLPSRLVVLRAIGNRRITFNLHVGPTPNDIVKYFYQQNEYEPPEKWILGRHVCRSGSKNFTEASDVYDTFSNKSSEYGLEYESDCFDENLYFMMMEEGDDASSYLESLNTRFIMSIFPHIPKPSKYFDVSLENQLFYLKSNTEKKENDPQNGTYFDLDVYYPDYGHENIKILTDDLNQLFETYNPVGYSFSNSWGSDYSLVELNTSREFIYNHENITKSFSKTLLYNATSKSIEHYYNHNSYGKNHVNSYNNYKPPIFSSVFTKNTIVQVENLNGTWENLKSSLSRTISHGLFAHPLISIPICGSTKHFDLESQIELCTRWYMMASFMPILKIKSEPPLRDPGFFETDHHRNRVIEAFKMREKFLLYLHTILIRNEPIVRPMFYEFYNDLTSFRLDEQYMIGESLLIAQPFLPECSLMRIYLPGNDNKINRNNKNNRNNDENVDNKEVFYEYFGGMEYSGDDLGWINLTCRPTDWFIFLRGGSILVLLEEKISENEIEAEKVKEVRFQVVVAFDTDKTASGSIILDGFELNFSANESNVTISKDIQNPSSFCNPDENRPTVIESFIFYGLEDSKKEVFKEIGLCNCGENSSIDDIDCVYELSTSN